MSFLGGIAFGALIGFLIWKFLYPLNVEEKVTLRRISSIIAVLLGGAISTFFPVGSTALAGYFIGILSGFAFIPMWQYYSEQTATGRKQREDEYNEEVSLINSNWAQIMQLIQVKMQRKMRQIQPGLLEGTLSIRELNELPYSEMGKILILRGYAQSNVAYGVELKSTVVENDEYGTEEELYYLYQLKTQQSPIAAETKDFITGTEIRVKIPTTVTTTYTQGQENYDDSISIETAAGEFVGECGVGISENIGDRKPKCVNAFELWLFDKNDSQTITKVLLSPYSFSDAATRNRLAQKGEIVLTRLGQQIVLATKTIQVVAQIVDLSFGVDTMPNESYFDRIKVKLDIRFRSVSDKNI